VPVPVCRTVEEAYQAGKRDALASPQARPELAEQIARALAPLLEKLAASREPDAPKLVRVTEAAEQLRVSKSQIYMLVRAGILDAERLTSHTGSEGAIRIKQSAIDAYIKRDRVTSR
jgi:excisionase family DNA binding protein